MSFSRLLCAGLIASVGLHFAGSAYVSHNPDLVQIEASAGGAVSVVGSLEDLVAGAKVAALESPDDPVPPVEEPLDVITPVTAPRAVAAVQPPPLLDPLEVTPAPLRAGVTETRAVTSEPVETVAMKPAEPVPAKPLDAQPPVEPAAVAKAERVNPVEQTEPLEPLERMEPVPPVEVITTDATPTAKPVQVASREPVRQKPQKTPKTLRQARGNAETDARRGAERVTSERGRSNANGRAKARDGERGQAAASNYKGKVLSRLRRAKRYPRDARRAGISGTATLRFTVSRNGSVSGVRIVRSSGAGVLDQAVLDLIRRASPMPAFPTAVSGNTMTFSVPIRFSSR